MAGGVGVWGACRCCSWGCHFAERLFTLQGKVISLRTNKIVRGWGCVSGLMPSLFPSVKTAPVSPPGDSLLPVAAKVSKSACPSIRPCASLRVRSLHRRSEGRHTRSFHGPLCLKRPSGPLAPLHNDSARPSGRGVWRARHLVTGLLIDRTERTFRRLGAESPSGGRVEVSWRGTSRRDAARGLKGQGRPL